MILDATARQPFDGSLLFWAPEGRPTAAGVRQGDAMTPQDNDVNKRQVTRSGSRESWGALPIILGAATVVIIGAWFYITRDDDHPVTGHDAASTQPPSK
jgi:hypothetical protein